MMFKEARKLGRRIHGENGGLTGRAAGAAAVVSIVLGAGGPPLLAGPKGEQVASGQASFSRQGSLTTITASNNSIINYKSFNIGAGETVRFIQPSATSRVLNRVTSADPTRIDGSLLSNGRVYISNSSGVYFGSKAVVNVGGIYAAAGTISNKDFLAGIDRFTDLSGQVINDGSIRGQLIHLLGDQVINNGSLYAPGGLVTMTSGQDVLIGERDGGVMVKVTRSAEASTPPAAGAAVQNNGTISAPGGAVNLGAGDIYALAIHNRGDIKAKTIVVEAGKGSQVQVSGKLDASDAASGAKGGQVTITADEIALYDVDIDVSGHSGGGEILIGGDFQGGGGLHTSNRTYLASSVNLNADAIVDGDGGKVIVWSDGSTWFYGDISARGGAQGGDGGLVEVSGKGRLDFDGLVTTAAPAGDMGLLLLDPTDLVISNEAAASGTDDGQIGGGDGLFDFPDVAGAAEVSAGALEALAAGTNISLRATNSITIQNLTAAGKGGVDGELTLDQTGSVEFLTGAGGFAMDPTDHINVTGGGTLRIDAIAGTSGGTGDGTVSVGRLTAGGVDISGTAITLGGSVSTVGGTQVYDGPVTLTSGVTLTGTAVGFVGSVNGAFNLDISGNATFGGRVGDVTPLTSLDVSGTTALNAAGSIVNPSVITTATQGYVGPVTLGAAGVLQGTTITFDSTVDGGFDLDVVGNAVFSGLVGDALPLLSLEVTGTTNFNAAGTLVNPTVDTTNNQNYGGPVTLSAATVLQGSSVAFSDTVDGGQTLSIAGNATFGGLVGDTTALTSLNVSGTTALNAVGSSPNPSISTTGVQGYTGPVTLTQDTVLDGTTITFGSTVNGASALEVAGNAVFGGRVGGVTPLTTLEVGGTSALNAAGTLVNPSVETTGSQSYNGAATLGAATVLEGTVIGFGSTVNGAFDLDVTGGATFGGLVGDTTPLASLDVSGAAALNAVGSLVNPSVQTVGAQGYAGAVTLGAATVLEGTTIALGSTVDGAQSLVLVGDATLAGLVGDTTPLSSFRITGTTGFNAVGTALNPSVQTTGAQDYDGAATLGAATVLEGGSTIIFGMGITGSAQNLIFQGASDVIVTGAVTDLGDGTDFALQINNTNSTTFQGNLTTNAQIHQDATAGLLTLEGVTTLGNSILVQSTNEFLSGLRLRGNVTSATALTIGTSDSNSFVVENAVVIDTSATPEPVTINAISTITGALTINAGAASVELNADAGGAGSMSITGDSITLNNVSISGAQTYTAPNISLLGQTYTTSTAAASAIQFNGDLTLSQATTTIETGGAAGDGVTFGGTITGTGGGRNLTVDAGAGAVMFQGASTGLGDLIVDGGAITLAVGAKVTAAGIVRFTGQDDVTINAQIDPTQVVLESRDDIFINANVTATNTLTITAGQGDNNGGITIADNVTLLTTADNSTMQLTAGSVAGGIAFGDSASATAGATPGTRASTLSLSATAGSVNLGPVTPGTLAAQSLVIRTGTGAGDTSPLQTQASVIDVISIAGDIDIDNNIDLDVSVPNLSTANGTINFDQSGMSNVVFGVVSTTGVGAIDLTVANGDGRFQNVSTQDGAITVVVSGDAVLGDPANGASIGIRAGTVVVGRSTLSLTAEEVFDANDDFSIDLFAGTLNVTSNGIGGGSAPNVVDVGRGVEIDATTANLPVTGSLVIGVVGDYVLNNHTSNGAPVIVRASGNLTVAGDVSTVGVSSDGELGLFADAPIGGASNEVGELAVNIGASLAAGSGRLTLSGATINLTAADDNSLSGVGALRLQPSVVTRSIGIGTGAGGEYQIDNADLLALGANAAAPAGSWGTGFTSVEIGLPGGAAGSESVTFAGGGTLIANVPLITANGAAIRVNAALVGGSAVNANSRLVINGAGNTTTLGANITMPAGIEINDSVRVASNTSVTLNSSGSNGAIHITGTVSGVQAALGTEILTLNAGSGAVTLDANVIGTTGSSTILDSLIITNAGNVTMQAVNAAISFRQDDGTGTTAINGLITTAVASITTNDIILLGGVTAATGGATAIELIADNSITTVGGAPISASGGGVLTMRAGTSPVTGTITSGSPITSTGGGDITLSSNVLALDGNVTATGATTDITIEANTLTFGGAITVNGVGLLNLRTPGDAGTIGLVNGAGSLQLPATFLEQRLADGFQQILIGRATGTGAINIGAAAADTATFRDRVLVQTANTVGAGPITINGRLVTTTAADTIDLTGRIALNNPASTATTGLITTNNGLVTLTGTTTLNQAATIVTGGANALLTGTNNLNNPLIFNTAQGAAFGAPTLAGSTNLNFNGAAGVIQSGGAPLILTGTVTLLDTANIVTGGGALTSNAATFTAATVGRDLTLNTSRSVAGAGGNISLGLVDGSGGERVRRLMINNSAIAGSAPGTLTLNANVSTGNLITTGNPIPGENGDILVAGGGRIIVAADTIIDTSQDGPTNVANGGDVNFGSNTAFTGNGTFSTVSAGAGGVRDLTINTSSPNAQGGKITMSNVDAGGGNLIRDLTLTTGNPTSLGNRAGDIEFVQPGTTGTTVATNRDLNLNPQGFGSAPTDAVVYIRNGAATFVAGDDFRMGQNVKMAVLSNLTINAQGGDAFLSDLSVLGDTTVNVGIARDIRLVLRAPGEVQTQSFLGALAPDLGVDFVTGGRHIFSKAPITEGDPFALPQPTFANPAADGDLNNTLSGYSYRQFGMLNVNMFVAAGDASPQSVGNILDLRSSGPSNTDVSEALAAVIPTPHQSGNVIRDTLVGQSQSQVLGQMGLTVRGMPILDFIVGSAGIRTYNDIPGNATLSSRDVLITDGRLDYNPVAVAIDNYRQLFFKEVTDPKTGKTTLVANQERIKLVLQQAFDAYKTKAGDKIDPAAFAAFVQGDPKQTEALSYLEGLGRLFESIRILGVTPHELASAKAEIFNKGIVPTGMTAQQLDQAVGSLKPR